MGKSSITVTEDDLVEIQDKLGNFMKDLPDEQRNALKLVLARAASSDAPEQVVNAYLSAADESDARPLLPLLARSIDGRSNVGPDATLWSYVVWTHNHKS